MFEPTQLNRQEVAQFNSTIAANTDSSVIKEAAQKATSAGIALTPPHLSEFIGSESDLIAAYRDWSHGWEVAAQKNPNLYGKSTSSTSTAGSHGMFPGSFKVSELYYTRPTDGKKLALVTCREEGGDVKFFDGNPLANFELRDAQCPDGDPKTAETKFASAQEQKAAEAKANVDDVLQPTLERKERKLGHLKESLAQIEQGLTAKQGPKKISVYEELDGLRKAATGTDKKSREDWSKYQELVKFVYAANEAKTDATLDRKPTGDLEGIESAQRDILADFLSNPKHSRINAFNQKLYEAKLASYMPGDESTGERAPTIPDDQFGNSYSYERFPTSVVGANEAKRVLGEQIAQLQPEVDRRRIEIAEQKKLYPDVKAMASIISNSGTLGIARYANSIADHGNSVAKEVAAEALMLHGAELLKQPDDKRDTNRYYMVSLALGRLIISNDDPDHEAKRTALSNLLTGQVGGDTGRRFFNEPPASYTEPPKQRIANLQRMIDVIVHMATGQKAANPTSVQP